VRAIGFAVPERRCVTVSMNLVDHEVTGLRTAFDAVKEQAEARGMKVLDSEIVGLVPQAAIADEDVAFLRLEGFDADGQILERLVSAAEMAGEGIRAQPVEEFLEALASERPTPGGGAVAALAGAFGAALLDMVARLTIDKKGYEDAWDPMREVSARAREAREAFLALADRDVAAFDELMSAFRLPKDIEEQKADRSRAIRAAYLAAAEVPLKVARAAAGLMELALETVEVGNANAASDAASAGQQLFAATKCAIHNVEINVAGLKDAERAEALRAEVQALRAKAEELLEATDRAFAARVT
ncbi:MAG: cyclodeaminase/cyclohydrolase family protein, partial [Actinomycetota bacterium]